MTSDVVQLRTAMRTLEANLALGQVDEAQIETVVHEMEDVVRRGWSTLSWSHRLYCLYKVKRAGGAISRCMPDSQGIR